MIDNKGKQNFRNIKRGYAKSKIGCQFVHFRGRYVSPPENMGKQFPFLILFSGRSKAVSYTHLDLAATLLGQLGLEHTAFTFSRNVLGSDYK